MRIFLLILCLVAAALPFLPVSSLNRANHLGSFHDDEEVFKTTQKLLPEFDLLVRSQREFASNQEEDFYKHFPGKLYRFNALSQEGSRSQVLVRLINKPSRKLHSLRECMGGKFTIEDQGVIYDERETPWQTFKAEQAGVIYFVRETFCDLNGSKNNRFADVSAWYWRAILSGNEGGGSKKWISIAVLTRR